MSGYVRPRPVIRSESAANSREGCADDRSGRHRPLRGPANKCTPPFVSQPARARAREAKRNQDQVADFPRPKTGGNRRREPTCDDFLPSVASGQTGPAYVGSLYVPFHSPPVRGAPGSTICATVGSSVSASVAAEMERADRDLVATAQ